MKKSSRSSPPRLVDTWVYDVEDVFKPDVDEEDEEATNQDKIVLKKIEMEVRLDKEADESMEAPYPIKKVKFIVSCSDPEFKITGTDIEELRSAAYSRVAERFKIEWHKYYLVEISHQSTWGGEVGTGFIFSYDDIEKGLTWDGKVLMRKMKRGYRGGYDWEIKTWPGAFKTQGGKTIACIPATDANTASLEEFTRRINKLRELIEEMLKPEVILQTLQNLAGLKLLPPAPEEEAGNESIDV